MRAALLLLALAACAPVLVPVEVAERQCADRALAQAGGTTVTTGGAVGLGVVSGPGGTRPASNLSLSIGANVSPGGRDPNAVFTSCVVQRSGQYPTRPLFDRG